MTIDLIPDLKKYPHIYGAHKDGNLIIFIGAGLSALWGCKRWKDMAIALIDKCYEQGDIDYWEREMLVAKYATAPRKLITIAKNILKTNYEKALRETLELNKIKKAKLPNLMNNLFSFEAMYITTNIDNHFSSLFDENNIHSELNKFVLKPQNIVHIHGIIDKPNSLVMTVDEYITRYKNDYFRDFLETTFFNEKYCFLFIGYGVEEMEIIDFIIQKYSEEPKTYRDFIHRFYVLLPFYQQEEQLYQYEQLYFDKIKMNVIPYSINSKGYDQLNEILESWREIFKDHDKDDFYKNIQIIDRNL